MRTLTKIFLVLALIVTGGYTFAASRQGEKADTLQKVNLQLSGFTSIKVAGPFNVHIVQGNDESVKFEAGADVVNRILTEVDGHVLKIRNKHDNWSQGYKSWYSDKGVWHNHKKIEVYITAKDVKGITVSGSGSAVFADGLAATGLKLRVRGSGVIEGKVNVKTLQSHISGSGSIKLNGNAESSAVLVRGSGSFTTRNLMTANSKVHVSGSGRAEVNATDKVKVTVRGSGDVNYTGTAKIVSASKSGSGEISRF